MNSQAGVSTASIGAILLPAKQLLTVSRRAFLACAAVKPMSVMPAIWSSLGSPAPAAAATAAPPAGKGSSMSGSSMWPKSQFIAASASLLPVASNARWQRTSGKPIPCSWPIAASLKTTAGAAPGASAGNSSSPGWRP